MPEKKKTYNEKLSVHPFTFEETVKMTVNAKPLQKRRSHPRNGKHQIPSRQNKRAAKLITARLL